MSRDKELNMWELPFHSPDEKDELCLYNCPRCGCDDVVPAFVAVEFKTGVACPKCDFKMDYKYSFFDEPCCD